jgi:hypothetical protein
VIAGVILIIIFLILVISVTRAKKRTIALEDVIPQGRVVTHEDGIVEYQGVYYILGSHDFDRRRRLLGKLPQDAIQSPCIVDMRFNSQIIIKKGPFDDRTWSGPGMLEKRGR